MAWGVKKIVVEGVRSQFRQVRQEVEREEGRQVRGIR